jgi:hypothetical protein
VRDDINLTFAGYRNAEAGQACVLGKGRLLNHNTEDKAICHFRCRQACGDRCEGV